MDRERGGDLVHARPPAGWYVGPSSYDPARHRWEIVARSPRAPGHRSTPAYGLGEGLTELAVLLALAAMLGAGVHHDDVAPA